MIIKIVIIKIIPKIIEIVYKIIKQIWYVIIIIKIFLR